MPAPPLTTIAPEPWFVLAVVFARNNVPALTGSKIIPASFQLIVVALGSDFTLLKKVHVLALTFLANPVWA